MAVVAIAVGGPGGFEGRSLACGGFAEPGSRLLWPAAGEHQQTRGQRQHEDSGSNNQSSPLNLLESPCKNAFTNFSSDAYTATTPRFRRTEAPGKRACWGGRKAGLRSIEGRMLLVHFSALLQTIRCGFLSAGNHDCIARTPSV